jgi:hypothetical protein
MLRHHLHQPMLVTKVQVNQLHEKVQGSMFNRTVDHTSPTRRLLADSVLARELVRDNDGDGALARVPVKLKPSPLRLSGGSWPGRRTLPGLLPTEDTLDRREELRLLPRDPGVNSSPLRALAPTATVSGARRPLLFSWD